MKILIGLLGIWCFWNAMRLTGRISHAIVFGEDQTVYWAGFLLFMAGTFGCVVAVLGQKK